MKKIAVILVCMAIFAVFCKANAASKSFDFEKKDITGWEIEGAVEASSEKAHGGKSSLKIGPKSTASFNFEKKNVPVKATFWALEAGAKLPATNEINGPRWGLKNEDEDKFCMVLTWRKYIEGYAYSSTAENRWDNAWWPKLKRRNGWVKWIFDFTNDNSPAVYCDEDEATLDPEKLPKGGFLGVYFEGVDPKAGDFYVDDIDIRYGK